MIDMTGITPYDRSEREFLHDLANPLAIAYGNVRIIEAKLEGDLNALEPAKILEKLKKVVASFDKANELLDRRRAFLKDSDVA